MKFATWAAVLLLSGLSPLAGQIAEGPTVAPEAADLRAHYLAVLDELRAADTAGLSDSQRANRVAMIDELAAYVARGDFGHDATPQDRQNLFRDADGRLCAVGNLLWASGETALVERIARERNAAFVLELAGVAGLGEWLASVGLTVEEAARVQGPGMTVPVEPPDPPAPPGTTFVLPGKGARAHTDRPGPSSAPSAPAGASTGAPDRARRSASTQGLDPLSDPLTEGGDIEDWWIWWEMNKADFLPPRRLDWPKTDSGLTDRYVSNDARQRALEQILPELRLRLADGDAGVRAAAAIALGRLGGDSAVPDLLPLLSDSAVAVREAAILSLGATGSMVGAHALLSLAQSGELEGTAAESGPRGPVCSSARPLALVALGVARRRGLAAIVDDFVAPLLDERGDDARDVRVAALLGLDLARSPLVSDLASKALAQEGDDPQLACRAIEALGGAADPAHVPLLLSRAGARDLEERRAAVAALASCDDPLLSAALRTAFEVEEEPFARGLLLVTLGAQGGGADRDFLAKVATRGSSANRPWAALGLGLLARRDQDEAARAVLRGALRGAGESQGAWILACGIAQDPEAGPELARLLETSRNPRVRMFAALAMAMCDAPGAVELLAARLEVESAPLARVGLAQGLGVLGRPEDASRLLAELRELKAPIFAAQFAAALGFHGSREAVDGLTALALDDGTAPLARAAALDALGLLLDRGEPLLLTETTRGRNYRTLPTWLAGVLPTTTL
jgi:HEAT repeat protein